MKGKIQKGRKIGNTMGVGRDRHVRVTLRSMEDKVRILKNRGLLKGTHIYLHEDLTLAQQEERRREWEEVRLAREVGKWAWLKNGKAQVTDRLKHKKYGFGAPCEYLNMVSWNCRG